MQRIDGGVTAAKGFKATGLAVGIKNGSSKKDMAMVYCDVPCKVNATFTTNVVKAAPVKWDKDIVENVKVAQAVVANSGVANACTGEEGMEYCRQMAETTGKLLNIPANTVMVASTGVIGRQLPMDKINSGIEKMAPLLDYSLESGTLAAEAIMTTDTVSKQVAFETEIGGKTVRVGGMCKGSGMIHPNMCTMLAFITTDVNISDELLKKAVKESVNDTFNMITVDGDTSTNDTFMCLADGLAENPEITEIDEDYNRFYEMLLAVNTFLAKKMAADGEGASKLFEAKVINAKTKEDAKILSRAIVGSNLSKAAIFGCDANFGRFLCAMGYSGSVFNEENVELYFVSKNGKIKVFDKGTPIVFDEDEALKIMKADEVTVFVNMNEGDKEATAWGCDLTYDYVKINADYRS